MKQILSAITSGNKNACEKKKVEATGAELQLGTHQKKGEASIQGALDFSRGRAEEKGGGAEKLEKPWGGKRKRCR